MQGLWKENVSVWNNKDTRRKKVNRKHYLKDKGNSIRWRNSSYNRHSKKVQPEVFSVDEYEIVGTNAELNPTRYKNIKYFIEVWNITWYGKSYQAYNWNDKWYDSWTHIEIKPYVPTNWYEKMFYDASLRKHSIVDIIPVTWDKRIEEKDKMTSSSFYGCYNSKEFIYGKLLKWGDIKYYGYKNKYTQKFTNSSERGKIKNLIFKEFWKEDLD